MKKREKRVLIVSDNKENCSEIASALNKVGGYEVIIAETIYGARVRLAEGMYTAIFWDFELIDGNTEELIRLTRKKFTKVKMIAVSVSARYREIQLNAGCNEEIDPLYHPKAFARLIVKYIKA